MAHPFDSLVFITITENHSFSDVFPEFDPSIPLPVQLSAPDEKIELSGLSNEMILAGILTVFAYDRDNPHLEYYRSIIRAVYPSVRDEMTEVAVMKIKNGDFNLAEEIFLALNGLDPQDMQTVLNLALLNDERSDNMRRSGLDDEADLFCENAVEFYRTAIAAEQPMPEAFFHAGLFYLKQKNFKKARHLLETYMKTETAETEQVQARKDRALQIINSISSSELDDDLFKSAYDFINMGQEERALEQIRLFLEHHPKVWNAWFLLGWALRRLKRWEDARAAFIQALELGKLAGSGIESAYTDICNELSICLMELGETDESRKWLISALEQEPENTKIISNLGLVALKQGNPEEAAGFFRTVLEIDPNDYIAREMLDQITEK
ncbi:tetratricopeptide repeat protein [Brucepastera parasyntrophica]|uniref:tetratricopeptide repeat protein n=1 Tax=Brucepastera parasyntrophica TaxID=2880008 RepID=UPI002108C217|nr:tetratricopeptide repeat protein [Brucepastera parasyntrophica]ULQ60646.1 tetratricopeptide repeat protein [Brucepastera parasyntrophica]